MNIKTIAKTTVVILVVASSVLFIFQGSFTLFDEEPIEITQFNYNKASFAIYYISSNATQQDYIQIRRILLKGNFKVLTSFERYQILSSYKLFNDTLQLVLSDTSSYKPRQDTLKVRIE
ncbi:hypothetical protein GCM10028803_04160 [Larkinella knui]